MLESDRGYCSSRRGPGTLGGDVPYPDSIIPVASPRVQGETPLVYVPMVDVHQLEEPSIIDGF